MKSYCNRKKSLPQTWTVQGPKGSLSVSDRYSLCSINLLILLLSKPSQFYRRCWASRARPRPQSAAATVLPCELAAEVPTTTGLTRGSDGFAGVEK